MASRLVLCAARRVAVASCLVVLALPAFGGETRMASPLPDWDNPRRIVLQMTENDAARVNGILSNAANLLEFYGMGNVEVAVVAYGPGVRALLSESAVAPERVASLQHYGVEFVACGNTLNTLGKDEGALLPEVEVVQAGIAEIVERTLRGWHYIVP